MGLELTYKALRDGVAKPPAKLLLEGLHESSEHADSSAPPQDGHCTREDVKVQDQHLQSVGPHEVPDGTTAHMHAPLMPAMRTAS